MARGKCTFRQRDVTAALRAVEAAGLSVARIQIDPAGNVTVHTGAPEEEPGSGVITDADLEKYRNAFRPQKRRASGEPQKS